MKASEAMYRAALFEYQMKEIGILSKKIKEGLDIREVLRSDSSKIWTFRNKLRNRLLEIMTRTMNFGRGQVQDELKRQQA